MCYGPEFVAHAVKDWISGVGARTAYIEPGSPWENGYVESFNGKLRDEQLNAEVFNTLAEEGADRAMAHTLQSRAPALISPLPPARTGGGHAESARAANRPWPAGFSAALRGHCALNSEVVPIRRTV